jgi:hypothetical protein
MANAGGGVDLASLLGVEEAVLDDHLAALHDDGLLESPAPPYDLTPQAQFLINERFEEINF